MFTPNLPASNAAAIRADGYSARCHAHFFVPRIVAQGTVGAPTYPQAGQNPIILTLSYTTGAYTDVVYGMRITFTDASGNWKGESYVRTAEISAFVIQIPEYAQAKLNLDTGDIFTVWDEWRVHPLIVGARASFPPDLVEHTDEGSEPAPWINNGGLIAVKVDDGETFASIPFDLTGSFTVAPGSSGTINFTTHTQTGVAIAAGYTASDDQLVLEVDVGHYTIRFEGEDDTTGKVGYKYTPVIVYDDDNPPHEVFLTAYDGTLEGGFNFSIEVLSGTTNLATIPDECLCILSTDERYAEAWASYRNNSAGREGIIGAGYIRRETSSLGEDGVTTLAFEVESPLSILKQLTSYSKVLEENATPDSWSEILTLSVLRAQRQLMQYYTNYPQVWDTFYSADLYNPRYPQLYLQRSNFFDQSKELLDGIDAVLSCGRNGRFDVYTFQPFVPLADRASAVIHWTFTANDVLTWSINRIHYYPVEQYKTSGFTGGTSGNVPLFSLYPGHAPGTGIDAPTRDRLIVVDQADLNQRTGRYGALADDLFMDADGLKYRAFELQLTLRGSYNFLDFGNHFYEFSESLRGLPDRLDETLDFAGDILFYLTAVSWSAGEQGEGETQATFRVATNAAEGETYTPPPDTSVPWTPLPTHPPIALPDLFPGTIGRGVNRMATINVNGVSTTESFQSLSPVWAALVKNWGGTLLQWVPNGFDPGKGWVITSTKIEYLTLSTGACTLKHTFAVASNFRSADASFAQSNHLVVVSFDATQGTTACYTSDNSTFTEVVINAATSPQIQPGTYVSSKTANKVVTSVATGTTTSAAYNSSDNGANWSTLSPAFINSVIGHFHIHAPWKNNPDIILYYSVATDTTGSDKHRYYRYVNGTNTEIAPSYSGERYMPYVNRNGAETSVLNENRMLLVGRRSEAGGPTFGVWLTNNARVGTPTWTLVDTPGGNYRRCALAGDDPNTGWVFGVSGAIAQVTISGSTATLSSRTGNLAALTPGETIGIGGW